MTSSSRDPDEPNGILAAVPGETIAAAARQLPPHALAEPDARESVEIEGPAWVGRVRISFRRHRWKHGRHYLTAWVAVHAERM